MGYYIVDKAVSLYCTIPSCFYQNIVIIPQQFFTLSVLLHEFILICQLFSCVVCYCALNLSNYNNWLPYLVNFTFTAFIYL